MARVAAGRYAGIVVEMATLRRLIDAGQRVAEVGYSLPDDVGTALGQAEAMVLEVGQAKGPDSPPRRPRPGVSSAAH